MEMDADLLFQQDLPPAHRAKTTSSQFAGHGITVLVPVACLSFCANKEAAV